MCKSLVSPWIPMLTLAALGQLCGSSVERLPEDCGRAPASGKWMPPTNRSDIVERRSVPSYVRFSFIKRDPSFEEYQCGGTILSKRLVLTSARCLANIDGAPVLVVVDAATPGSIKIESKDTLLSFAAIPDMFCLSKRYSERSGHAIHDIAVVQLSRELRFSDAIQPACLPAEDDLEAPSEGLYAFSAMDDLQNSVESVKVGGSLDNNGNLERVPVRPAECAGGIKTPSVACFKPRTRSSPQRKGNTCNSEFDLHTFIRWISALFFAQC